jgi:hypothetical protein
MTYISSRTVIGITKTQSLPNKEKEGLLSIDGLVYLVMDTFFAGMENAEC